MLLTATERKESSKIHEAIEKELQDSPRPLPDYTQYAKIQPAMVAFERQTVAALGPPDARISELYETIMFRDGESMPCKVVRPAEKPARGSPVIALLFGGGFICGSVEQLTATARTLALLFDAVVVSLPYRLAPQHRFPTQQLDCLDGIAWIMANISELEGDPSKGFIIGGLSAGATCAASVSRMMQERPLAYPLTGQWLACPGLLEAHLVPTEYQSYFTSREQNADAPTLDAVGIAAIRDHVQWDDQSSIRYPTLSNAPTSGQPATFMQVNGMDPLRDDGLIYDEMLRAAGVKTKINFYQGTPHGHWTTYKHLPMARQAYVDFLDGFAWLLDRRCHVEEGLRYLGL